MKKKRILTNEVSVIAHTTLMNSYITHNNINLSSHIPPSIFETNSFLIGISPQLIEYAAFYGSIEIFNYLRFYNCPANPELMLYAIHSNNAELISLIDKEKVEPDEEEYLKEFIKCHHNEIALYFKQKILSQNNLNSKQLFEFNDMIYSCSFEYSNYSFYPKKLKKNYAIYYLSKYNYNTIIKDFYKLVRKEINRKRIKVSFSYKRKEILRAIQNKKFYIAYFILSNGYAVDENTFSDIQ